ncbi:hypothetical protein [Flavobacterium pectinovorum]|uniref:hypothetical protein n=1 Tax=Flavobacterium pectinovorum TaxID=29533 RepID=UPI001FACAF54|nr:hypothetical protein [Flavobacterium pectinovorum]MCI9846471.1 hypothetical protein [Flavobacterium pectinovorum]
MTKKKTTEKGLPLNIILAILFILFLIIGSIVHSCSKSNTQDVNKYEEKNIETSAEENIDAKTEDNNYSVTTYYVKQQTYAGTCEECFDEIFDYCKVDDRKALQTMEYEGKMKILHEGQKVYLLDAGLTYAIVREEGSTEKLWVVNEHIEKH